MHDSVRDAFLPFNEPLEGRVRFMYLDVKSLVSTGVGNLLDADDPGHFGSNAQPLPDIFNLGWFDKTTTALADHTEISAEYRNVKFSGTTSKPLQAKEAITQLRITDAAINDLVSHKLDSFENALRQRADFADLNQWPADGQLGLLSMAWAMGPLFSFPKFQAAAAAQEWLTMAQECKMTEAGNPGVVPRNVRNGLLFTLAGWMAAPPPGDFTQLVFDPAQELEVTMRSGAFPIPMNLAIGLQTALETLGFDPHGLDGVLGKNTRTALNAFQTAHGLPPTSPVTSINDVPRQTLDVLLAQLDDKGTAHFADPV